MKKYNFLLFLVPFSMFSQNISQNEWSLNSCIDYAVENNITVKKAIINKNSSEIYYKQSRNNRLPTINASGSQNFTHGSAIDPISSKYVDKNTNSTSIGANAQISLFEGGKINKQIDQNKIILEQSDLLIKEAQNNIILNITQAFIQALFYKEDITIAENTLASSNEELEIAKIKYKEGSIAKKDLVDIESQNANDKYKVLAAKNAYDQQVFSIKQLLELSPNIDFNIDIPSVEGYNTIVPSKDDIYSLAIQNLPDIRSQNLQKEIKQKDIEIAKSGYLPTVSLSGGLNTGYTDTQDDSFTKQFDNNFKQQLGLSINVPIFNKMQTKSSVELAKMDVQQAELDLISKHKDLYKDIETAWMNYNSNAAEEEALKIAKDASELSYKMAQIKYNNGALTATDLLVSKNSYLNAEQKYLQTKYMVVLYYQLLQYYQGKEIKL